MKKSFIFTLCFLFLIVACQKTLAPTTQESTEPESTETNDTAVSEPTPFTEGEPESGVEATAVSVPTDTQPTLTPPPPPPEPENTEPNVDTVAEPSAVQPSSETVTIEAADGLAMQATYAYPGGLPPYPGVMLLHMLGSDRNIWQEYAFLGTLMQDGYAVIAVDMRGHGETGGDIDWELAKDDLQRVYDYFISQAEVDGNQTAVIGASVGANMTLVTAVNQPDIDTIILLSPGLDYRGVTTDDQISLYGNRPILIVASEEDTYAADSSQQLFDAAAEPKAFELYNGAGHGTTMFANEADLPNLILDWLRQHIIQ